MQLYCDTGELNTWAKPQRVQCEKMLCDFSIGEGLCCDATGSGDNDVLICFILLTKYCCEDNVPERTSELARWSVFGREYLRLVKDQRCFGKVFNSIPERLGDWIRDARLDLEAYRKHVHC